MRAFLRSKKEVIFVKNSDFRLKTANEKQRRLAAVLRDRSGCAVDEAMIRCILPRVSIHRQYIVSAFSDNKKFHDAIARAQAGTALLSVVFSQGRQAPAAAVITPQEQASARKGIRAIYIYAPNPHYWEGPKNG